MSDTICRTLFLLVVVLTAQLFGCMANIGGGFSVEFIHRDSPESSFHDPSLTPHARLLAVVRRLYPGGSHDGAVSEVVSRPFEYLMYVNVGMPHTRVLALVATGTQYVWFKCGYGGNGLGVVYDPSSSSTYGRVGCQSDSCHEFHDTSYDASSFCQYRFTYNNGSSISGMLSTETFTFDDAPGGCFGCRERPQLQVDRVNFGCSMATYGMKFDANGIVGLGDGDVSLVNQIGAATLLGRRFSYCLPPFSANVSSALNFGSRATVTKPGAVTTPLVPSAMGVYYTILIASIRVGKLMIAPSNPFPVVIDMGSVLTYLDKGLLDQIVDDLTRSIDLPRKQSPDKMMQLCYEVTGGVPENRLPGITLKLGGGGVVTLKWENTFMKLEEGTICLAMTPVTDGRPEVVTIGSIAQQNMHVGFDLDKRTVTFATANCATSYLSPPAFV